ncbi:hypothetical protein [Streptomyces sp. NPDC101150]|uniref:hypothetical protein n=1 Tax=Streptomyces sp. NPDC101150 TaxID=3366114 RepID=UPI00380DE4EE
MVGYGPATAETKTRGPRTGDNTCATQTDAIALVTWHEASETGEMPAATCIGYHLAA